MLFLLTIFTWGVYLSYSLATRPSYPTYPDIGTALALAFYTLAFGVVAFLLAALGLYSPNVSKRWAWAGLILNAPVFLYLVGYYPTVFAFRLFNAQ